MDGHARETGSDGLVICALSGGVNSAVAAALVHRAVGDRLTCIYVDHGLMRKKESELLRVTFERDLGMRLVMVDARERFLARLAGVEDPEEKRRIIGDEFIRVFEEEAAKLGRIDFLTQGTLYPDVIESTTAETKTAQKIKTHHNVGGLPADLRFQLIEPLRYLFKDEVRKVGLELGLPEAMVLRQPFPGPGLAIRIIGEVTAERLDTLRDADWISKTNLTKYDRKKKKQPPATSPIAFHQVFHLKAARLVAGILPGCLCAGDGTARSENDDFRFSRHGRQRDRQNDRQQHLHCLHLHAPLL